MCDLIDKKFFEDYKKFIKDYFGYSYEEHLRRQIGSVDALKELGVKI